MSVVLLAAAALGSIGAIALGLGLILIQIGAVGSIAGAALTAIGGAVGTVLIAKKAPLMPKGAVAWVLAVGSVLGVVVFMAVGLVVAGKAAGHYSWTVERLFVSAPVQPIEFPHPTHVQQAGIDCVFCHSTVDSEPAASVPPVEQCMFCHKVVGQDLPGVQQVMAAWNAQEPIRWNRVHRLPDHVRFVHEAHITYFTAKDSVPASAVCTLCHGEVGTMDRVEQVKELRMGFCVDCHRDNDAPTDCTTCHF